MMAFRELYEGSKLPVAPLNHKIITEGVIKEGDIYFNKNLRQWRKLTKSVVNQSIKGLDETIARRNED